MSFSEDASHTLPVDFVDTLGSLESNEDLISWINSMLSSSSERTVDLGTMDRLVSRVVASLDVASEDISLQLEQLVDDISRSASRLHYDLHFMRDGALSLQSSLNDLTSRANGSFSPHTNSALDKLHSLDVIKRNMEAARDVLREAESWSTLESEVSSLLFEQNYVKAAEKLSEANKSMVVFQNTSEYEHRRALMISLQNQLEASLSSALISAINSNDVPLCRSYYSIFDNIQRDAEFRAYYYGSRRSALVAMWQDANLSDIGETPAQTATSPVPFSAFLSSFFSAFLSTLGTEKTPVTAIFPDPQLTLSAFITSTMSSLQPTFAQRLNALMNSLGPSSLPELITAFKATEAFAVSADKILERTGSNSTSAENQAADVSTQKLHRRRSSRMSISRRVSISGNIAGRGLSGSGLDWDHELFEPFLEVQVEYGALEARFLSASLDNDGELGQDQARMLRERSVDVFSLAEESLGRMLGFTHGYGTAQLVKAVDTFVQTFLDASKDAFASQTQSVRGAVPLGASGDIADLDYSLEDWSHIQAWLHLLEALRLILDRLSAFESRLRVVLLQVAAMFRLQDAGLPYIPGATRGEITLLAQSELNNLELQTLLKELEPAPTPLTVPSLRPPADDRPLLVSARGALTTYTTTCQTALQDAMLGPMRKHLAGYAGLPLWTTTLAERPSGRRDVNVPTFSLSPSEPIQRVAEGLLNLPRLFEVYADDDALAFSLETLPFVDDTLLDDHTEPAHVPAHARRQSVISPPAPRGLPAEAIESIWLSALGRSLLTHLRGVLPKIRSLSANGAAQLASDLSYLGNIVGALNAEDAELELWRECTSMTEDEGRRAVVEGTRTDAVFSKVARMRGWIS
ncbi:Golgi complex component 7-domain-containing protein [Vararia minispora EC-137]|uniref:Golgi complex component 7-domain-containing protein n=1 Tax=Vararia minispora EC-137 TaxID=1314806 RepID=A0ACB8QS44_9AGAM|nr:Golgi complex component 7-domain-containing protein [Vararia minispora EC-137]